VLSQSMRVTLLRAGRRLRNTQREGPDLGHLRQNIEVVLVGPGLAVVPLVQAHTLNGEPPDRRRDACERHRLKRLGPCARDVAGRRRACLNYERWKRMSSKVATHIAALQALTATARFARCPLFSYSHAAMVAFAPAQVAHVNHEC